MGETPMNVPEDQSAEKGPRLRMNPTRRSRGTGLQLRDHEDVEVTGSIVVAKDDRNASPLAMRDEIRMRHGQFPSVGHVDRERLERRRMDRLVELIGRHAC
jgi:hypothetical protein